MVHWAGLHLCADRYVCPLASSYWHTSVALLLFVTSTSYPTASFPAYETTANSLAITAYNIAANPEVEARVSDAHA